MIMEEIDDVIFDDDEFDVSDSEQQTSKEVNDNSSSQQENNTNQEEEDLTTEVLRLKGITDPNKIKFDDGTGAVIERSWDSLSRTEQLNILLDNQEETDTFSEDEINLINQIRESGMSVDDYLESLKPEISQTQQFDVDSFSDEEMYAMDLLEKVGPDNISDEEITQAIELAKQNEDLFKKTVEGLRKEYVRVQQNRQEQIVQEQALKQEEAYNKFANSIQDQIRGLNSFAGQGLELSKDDIEELSSFILDLDESGMSAFGKAMNDPALFTKAAFWVLNEDKIVEELTKQMQNSYKRGYEEAKKDLQGASNVQNTSSKLVFKQPEKKVVDEFVDDDDW